MSREPTAPTWEYRIVRSDRRTLALQIKDGELLVRAPRLASARQIEAFVYEHEAWIGKHLAHAWRAMDVLLLREEELDDLVREARRVIPERVAVYADLLGVSYGRVTIRRQRTRWGSCNAKGDLSFNALLMLAPLEVLDAIVAHELCHRKQMNHSAAFYRELLGICPDYHARNAWLKEHGASLIARLPR